MTKPRYRMIKVGHCYKAKNPDDTYMYFKVMSVNNKISNHDEASVRIKIYRDDDTVYARAFRKGADVYIPKLGDLFKVNLCKPLSEEELLAVML